MSENLSMTYYFEDVFPDLENFNEFIENYSTVDMTKSDNVAFVRYCYQILMRHFNHCDIRYAEKESFQTEFLNVFENQFFRFKREKEIIDAIYSLTLEEVTLVSELISNNAKNPNTQVLEPKKQLPYIGEQNAVYSSNGKLDAYIKALNSVPTLDYNNFINEFKYLFMQILPIKKTIYEV